MTDRPSYNRTLPDDLPEIVKCSGCSKDIDPRKTDIEVGSKHSWYWEREGDEFRFYCRRCFAG